MPIKPKPDPFTYIGGPAGLLLVHGFTGSPAELVPMGQYFHKRGYTVHAPLLAGHGTSPKDMRRTKWTDWLESVVKAYRHMHTLGCSLIFAAGLSMGGTLVLELARTHSVAGVIPICAPITLRDRHSWLAPAIHYFKPYITRKEAKPPHIEKMIVPYDRMPVKCVASLRRLIRRVRRGLHEIHAPAFIAQARQDETVAPGSAQVIFDGLSSAHKRLRWYYGSHILTLEKERVKLFRDAEAFMQQVMEEVDGGKKRVH